MAVFSSPLPDHPQPFGYKQAWWVISAIDSTAVAQVLQLEELQPCTWARGITPEPNIFVSPPIAEWIFVIGDLAVLNERQGIELQLTPVLERLSRVFGVAHYFFTHRVVECHVWARAERGRLVRGYGYLGEKGETLWNEGDGSLETELGFAFFDETSPEAQHPNYWERTDLSFPNEDCVMQIARRWCLAPIDLTSESGLSSFGILAKFPNP